MLPIGAGYAAQRPTIGVGFSKSRKDPFTEIISGLRIKNRSRKRHENHTVCSLLLAFTCGFTTETWHYQTWILGECKVRRMFAQMQWRGGKKYVGEPLRPGFSDFYTDCIPCKLSLLPEPHRLTLPWGRGKKQKLEEGAGAWPWQQQCGEQCPGGSPQLSSPDLGYVYTVRGSFKYNVRAPYHEHNPSG